ncbi:MAG: hypothetical protein Q8Q47_07485 [Ignavibacteriaceae bacterium]|nr:hypothetical protein [Ignavibacteriaceae bacterium]
MIVKNECGFSEVKIEKISMMKIIADSKFFSYAQNGALISGGIMALVGIVNYKNNNNSDIDKPIGFSAYLFVGILYGAIYGIVGWLIGGIVGAVASGDEIYDFKGANINGKLTQINWILENKIN